MRRAYTNREGEALGPDEYLKDLNATQAAIRAGYSSKSARQEGTRLLSNASISDAIAELKQDRSRWCLSRVSSSRQGRRSTRSFSWRRTILPVWTS